MQMFFFSWQSCKFKSLCFGIDISIFHIKHCLILEFRIYTDEMTANSDFAILDLRFCLQLVLHALMSPIFLNITENLRSIALACIIRVKYMYYLPLRDFNIHLHLPLTFISLVFIWKPHLWFYTVYITLNALILCAFRLRLFHLEMENCI